MDRRPLVPILPLVFLASGVAAVATAVVLASTPAPASPLVGSRPLPGPAVTSLQELDRAILLLDEAWLRWRDGEELEDLAGWLEEQPDVEWAEVGEGTLRFQARGAMPLGLVSGERIEAPAMEVDSGDPSSQGGSTERRGRVEWMGSLGGSDGSGVRVASWTSSPRPGPRLLFPPVERPGPLPAGEWGSDSGGEGSPQRQEGDDHVISDNSDFTVKPFKRALVLGLFDWEFGPLETSQVSLRIQTGREFSCEGCVEVRTTDYQRPESTSPRCVPEPDGHCLPVQQTSWRDFLGWDAYDLIHVGTHGWQECRSDGSCYTAMATGRIGSPRQTIDGIDPGTGDVLRRLGRYDLIRSGVNVLPPGVEYHLVGSPSVCGERQGERATRREQRMGGVDDPYGYRVTDRNTAAWDLLCRDGMLLEAVTDRFFYSHYPNGLPDKLLVFSACEVFKDPGLARHLAGRERSSIFGWRVPVDNTVGREVMGHFYERLFPGAWVGGDQVAARGGGARAVVAWAEAVEMYYRPFLPGEELLSGGRSRRPAPDSSDFVDKRPKELPYLLDRRTDLEVQDGGRLELIGVSGDGRPDSLALTVEVHGLAEENDVDRFRVGFRLNGDLLPETYPPGQQVEDETWLFEGRVPLGRDATAGERVDLDVRVEIPGGGTSRWLYEDLLLVGACSFAGRISEIRLQSPRQRHLAILGEYHGRAVHDGHGSLTLHIFNRGDAPGYGTPDVTEFHLTEVEAGAEVGTLGSVPAQPGYLIVARSNPFHDPRRPSNGTRFLDYRYQAGIRGNQVSGSFDLVAFDPMRMAGSLALPLELAGNQLLFEADFDAGLRCEIH